MKKLAFFLVTFSVAAAFAEDSYLYWMINDAANAYSYDTVKIKASGEGETQYLTTYLKTGWNDGGTFTELELSNLTKDDKADIASLAANNTGFYASLAGYTGETWSYVVELYNGSQFLAQSSVLNYTDAAEYIATTAGGTGLQALAKGAWASTSYAVPEPSSALLMVFGLSALALRRRRQAKA